MNNLKLFSAYFDASYFLVFAKDIEDAKQVLVTSEKNKDNNFFIDSCGALYFSFMPDQSYPEEVTLKEVPHERKVVYSIMM